MRKIVGFGLLAGIGLLSPAFADPSEGNAVAATSLQSLASQVGQMGYDLQSARQRGGRYHANLLDRGTGELVHAEFRTTDGELISARLLAKDEQRDEHEREKRDADRAKHHYVDDDRN